MSQNHRTTRMTVTVFLALIAGVFAARSHAEGQGQQAPACTVEAGTMQSYFCEALLQRKRIHMDGQEIRMTAVHRDHFVLAVRRRNSAGDYVTVNNAVPYAAVRDVEVWGRSLVVTRR